MNSIIKNLFTLGLVTLGFLLSGCPDESTLRPEDTIVGAKKKSHPNWVDETQLYAKEGLSFREDFHLNEADEALLTGDDSVHETENLQIVGQVYFDYDNSTIRSNEREKLQEIAKIMSSNPKKKFLITGHCDWHGTQEYNMALGDRRANSAYKYLTQLGSNSKQLKTRSRGSLDAVKGAPDSQTRQDRRADLVMIK